MSDSTDRPASPPKRSGRRSGGADTRGAILGAARELFAARGLAGTTMRAIAEQAGVDSALIHHYFGSKQDLYLAASDLPINPEIVQSQLRDVPLENLGITLTTAVLTLWDSPESTALQARFRTAVGADHGAEIRDFLLSAAQPILFARLRPEDTEPGDPEKAGQPEALRAIECRIALALTQLLGAVVARHIVRLPGITDMTIDELASAIGPVVQAHLNGATLIAPPNPTLPM